MANVTVQGVEMSMAAAENVEECSVDVAADVAALRSGKHTAESLLAECLDGADADREQGWREYVDAVVAVGPASFTVKTSNGAFYQIHHVGAATEAEARELAERDADKSLSEERLNAAQLADATGEEPPEAKPYKAYKVEACEEQMALGEVRFVDSGSEA